MSVRFLAFLLVLIFPVLAFGSDNLSHLYEQAEKDGMVRVIVTFKSDGYDTDDSAAGDAEIRQRAAALRDAGFASMPEGSFEVKREFELLPAAVLEVTAEGLRALEESGLVELIEEDRLMKIPEISEDSLMYSFAASIGEETAWQSGYTGAGYYIAVLDTGIRKTHEAFAGKDIAEACFSFYGHCPNGQISMTGEGAAALYDSRYSEYVHGTHVSGIAAGNNIGVAKGADIIAVQIFSKFDNSECSPSTDCLLSVISDQVAALEYIYTLRNDYNIAAVNLSLGAECVNVPSLMRTYIRNLTNAGIAVVAAVGNSSGANTCNAVEAPACISETIAVGAVTSYDRRLDWSLYQKGSLDLYAPGESILSAGADSDTEMVRYSGTSMAAPHVAGAFAVLMEKDPYATVTELESLMKSTGASVINTCADHDNEKRVDLAAAVGVDIEQPVNGSDDEDGGGGGGCSASERGGVPLVLLSAVVYLLFNRVRRRRS